MPIPIAIHRYSEIRTPIHASATDDCGSSSTGKRARVQPKPG